MNIYISLLIIGLAPLAGIRLYEYLRVRKIKRWATEIPRARCGAFHFQYQCTGALCHADDHIFWLDDGSFVRVARRGSSQ